MARISLKKLVKSYPLSTLTCIGIWFLSLAPMGEFEFVKNAKLSDKWAHFIMYGGFVIVIWGEWLRGQWRSGGHTAGHRTSSGQRHSEGERSALGQQQNNGQRTSLGVPAFWVFVATVAMRGLLELLQAYCTTYRSGDWLDLAANAIGAALGTAVGLLAALLLRQIRR